MLGEVVFEAELLRSSRQISSCQIPSQFGFTIRSTLSRASHSCWVDTIKQLLASATDMHDTTDDVDDKGRANAELEETSLSTEHPPNAVWTSLFRAAQ